MDPKHQFAAQYVLSRAAAERREREILASSSLGINRHRQCACVPSVFERYYITFGSTSRTRKPRSRRGS